MLKSIAAEHVPRREEGDSENKRVQFSYQPHNHHVPTLPNTQLEATNERGVRTSSAKRRKSYREDWAAHARGRASAAVLILASVPLAAPQGQTDFAGGRG